jgi:transcriptional regulator with GAF, ATPase, and Fis domain
VTAVRESVDTDPTTGYPARVPDSPPPPTPLEAIEADAARALDVAREAKRTLILAALAEHGGNRTRAALACGYANAAKLRRAAARVGIDLATIPAPTPQEYGALRRNGPVAEKKR